MSSQDRLLDRPIIITTALLLGTTALTISATATAATIRNYDNQSYSLIVDADGETTEVTVGAQEQLENVCASTCVIELKDTAEAYEVADQDILEIQDGRFVFQSDDEETPSDDQDTMDPEPDPEPSPDPEDGEEPQVQ